MLNDSFDWCVEYPGHVCVQVSLFSNALYLSYVSCMIMASYMRIFHQVSLSQYNYSWLCMEELLWHKSIPYFSANVSSTMTETWPTHAPTLLLWRESTQWVPLLYLVYKDLFIMTYLWLYSCGYYYRSPLPLLVKRFPRVHSRLMLRDQLEMPAKSQLLALALKLQEFNRERKHTLKYSLKVCAKSKALIV